MASIVATVVQEEEIVNNEEATWAPRTPKAVIQRLIQELYFKEVLLEATPTPTRRQNPCRCLCLCQCREVYHEVCHHLPITSWWLSRNNKDLSKPNAIKSQPNKTKESSREVKSRTCQHLNNGKRDLPSTNLSRTREAHGLCKTRSGLAFAQVSTRKTKLKRIKEASLRVLSWLVKRWSLQ